MSVIHQLLLLVGLFGVPIALLVVGHRIKRESPARQRAFWGAVYGHVAAALLALYASLSPPTGWLPADTVRGALGLWSLVVFPLAGAFLGALRSSPES
ncbi:MAG: hypothetical protein IPK85_22570 [Gemmatimonadetes bacterium]|nr:hypothetical protein [Gemmatimonadota bacterium]